MNFLIDNWRYIILYGVPLLYHIILCIAIMRDEELATIFTVKTVGGVIGIFLIGIVPVFNILGMALAIYHHIETDALYYLKHDIHKEQ
jgi:hypothetical protein